MKFIKQYYQRILIIIYILISGLVNIYGFFKLPDEIATHYDFNGEKSNYIPTPIYLIISFLLIVFLPLLSLNKDRDRKIKLLITSLIIVIVNMVIIFGQIK